MAAPPETHPALSVVVLAWNQLPHTTRCVESIRRNTTVGYELIIVDNASEPDAAAYAAASADVAVLNESNLGFAAGMNAGLDRATGRYVAFVNNDTVFPPGWAETLLSTFEDFPGAGIVLPAVTAAGNRFSVREAPGADRVVAPPFRSLPSGVVYLLERETAVALGGWDERYGQASAEDLDLLWKVWVNGLDVVLDERTLVDHVGSATVGTVAGENELYRRNRLAFTDRWAGDDPGAPFLGRIDEPDFRRRLDTAAVACTWMRRAFVSEDAAEDARSELRRHEAAARKATPAPAPEPHRRWRRR